MLAWVSSSLARPYPGAAPRRTKRIILEAARNERLSFLAAFRLQDSAKPKAVRARVSAPEPILTQIRRVGCVPMPQFNTDTPGEELDGRGHIPGLVPDPLFEEDSITAEPDKTCAFWMTLYVPQDTKPGPYAITVNLAIKGGKEKRLTALLNVHSAVLGPRQNFPVLHILSADAICQWYKTELWEEHFWKIFDAYLENLRSHGQDAVYVPLFTPPLDGIKRPTQLLRVVPQRRGLNYQWDLVRRWIYACRKHGMRLFTWSHLFSQWGAARAIRVYEGNGETGRLLWPADTGALAPAYRQFLAHFLPKFRRFLQKEKITLQSLHHISDEPHSDHLSQYRCAREMMRELAPWMKTIDALSDPQFVRRRLVDIPVPIVSEAPKFVRNRLNHWVYYCCLPRGRYLNRMLDTPLTKVRMSGWIFHRMQARGFLHWGYNYWYKRETTELIDPFAVTDGGAWPDWAYGDPFVVYPGPKGPIDSIRWEVFSESLQDLALLQQAGIDPDDPMLADIKDYADFPRAEEWMQPRRKAILDILDKKQG